MDMPDINGSLGIEARYSAIQARQLRGDDYQDFLEDPDAHAVANLETAFDLIASIFDTGSVSELDLEAILYNLVLAFNRPLTQLTRAHGEACGVLRDLLDSDDHGEIGTAQIERAQAKAHQLDRRIAQLEAVRDEAVRFYEARTENGWMPPKGSVPSVNGITASARNAQQYLAAKRAREQEALAPKGSRIAIMGAPENKDKAAVVDTLDEMLAKYGDMVLVHAADKKNPTDNTAAKWARDNNVPQIPMDQPNFTKFKRAAPFKRNDDMISMDLTGVIILPAPDGKRPHGISQNLAQKATEAKVPVRRIKR